MSPSTVSENLTGAAVNEDAFDVAAAGSPSGTFDVAAGGFDWLVIDASGHSVVACAFDPHSGLLVVVRRRRHDHHHR